jgi:hypothetical protein
MLAAMNEAAVIEVERNAKGQFQPGHIGIGGRTVGARSKLTTEFLDDLRETWKTHGKQALERCAVEEPAQFCALVARLLPARDELDVNIFAEMTSVEIVDSVRREVGDGPAQLLLEMLTDDAMLEK